MIPYKTYSLSYIIKFTLSFLLLIWTIAIANLYVGSLNSYGIHPREYIGLIGIITHPFLHADLSTNGHHLVNNSLFLLFLIPLTLFVYQHNSKWIILLIIILTGSLVWLFGRPYNHVGASGLVFGLLSSLMTNALFKRNLKAGFSLLILLLTYGFIIHGVFPKEISGLWHLFQVLISNFVYGIFPNHPVISWESHLFGAISGILVAYGYRHYD